MSLIQSLPSGPLDIVGDIHGEYDALRNLMLHLGYDEAGHHPQGRTLVFVGDFCDRGPNSPAVLALVQSLVQSGHACARMPRMVLAGSLTSAWSATRSNTPLSSAPPPSSAATSWPSYPAFPLGLNGQICA